MATTLRLLLVDDHVLFRKGIAALLASRRDIAVVGEAGDKEEAVAKARELHPDAVLMDIRLPAGGGLAATQAIKREMPDVHVVMLTVSDDDGDLMLAIRSGAEGYLLKDSDPSELYAVLDAVRHGEARLTGGIASRVLAEIRRGGKGGGGEAVDERTEGLSPREMEVLEKVVAGLTNKEIGAALGIAENTVKIHLRNILEKLHVHNRTQLAAEAVRSGLVARSDPAGAPGDPCGP